MCLRCDGSGFIVVCIDDMCRGAGECMHGPDGMAVCPDCQGLDNEELDDCPECAGIGTVIDNHNGAYAGDQPIEEVITCPACGGEGK